ncbi:MAG: acyl-CoA dehydrogenase [Candidatus Binatia bacterium]|nr:MAG: acyl-CoA dehydrogenase [Candidatus Binatia bacterium]
MDFRSTPEEERFREEVARWLRENLPPGWGTPAFPEPETTAEKVALAKSWQRKLYDGGWAGMSWPKEYGGRGASVVEQLLFNEEYAKVGPPDLTCLSVGLSLVGPTLIAHGQEWQKKRFLPPILRGEEVWCQGFSEPNAGSDLASLRTRAELRGDEFVVTGQKIWTSFAQHAQWCILVVRTDPEAPKHKGLSFLLVDMGSPGITIRPLREITGDAWFNEVFFDEVRVPRENLVGEMNDGWRVVLTTLAHERGVSAPHVRLKAEGRRLARLARPKLSDPRVRQKLAQLAVEAEILRLTAYRNVTRIARTGEPGTEGSLLKLMWSELDQRLKDTAFELLGVHGLLWKGSPRAVENGWWAHELLWSRAATIYAGTSEIQRNIVAQRVLGLPRG